MITISIPGLNELTLKYALMDYNGTLAINGKLIEGLETSLNALSKHLEIHIITGDGFGTAKAELADIHCKLIILPPENQGIAKQKYLQHLNPEETVAIGNGRNDSYMLKDSVLGIVILGQEGAAVEAITSANLLLPSIFEVFDLFQQPRRLMATLRS